MVRKALVALATMASVANSLPYTPDFPVDAAWRWYTPTGSAYYTMAAETKYVPNGNGANDVWLHGKHGNDKTTTYRSSMWLYRFYCDGTVSLRAFTKYDAVGSPVGSWDGFSPGESIRPGTMFESLEKAVCHPNE